MPKTSWRISVVGIVSTGKDKFLLVQKKSSSGQELAGRWVFPGGDLRPGEDPRDALRNLISKDLSLEVEVGEILDVGVNRRGRRGQTEFIITMWLEATLMKSSALRAVKKWEAAEWVLRREVFTRLSERVRRHWLPPEVQMHLMAWD